MRPKISEKEIALRKRYTELTEGDVALLKEIQPIVTAHLDELVDAFYSHLLHFEETKKILKDEATVNRLKDAHKRYLIGLFGGDYGPEYVESRFRIGEVHYRIGLGIKWYLGAVHRYEWQLVGLIRKHTQFDKDKLQRVGRAICSILYFDTQWALETYELAYTEELRNKIEELRIHAHQQEVVTKIGMRALAVSDLSTLMDEAVAIVAETLGVEYCKVLELLPDKRALLLRAGVGWKEGLVGHATVGTGADSQAGYTLLSNEPVIVEDLSTETRFSGPPLLRDHGVVSGISVIIQTKDGPFGVLGAHTTRQRRFTRDNSNFLQAIANVLAAAIEHSRLQERLDYVARYDAITGLPNRILFLDRLSQLIAQAKRGKRQMAVLLIHPGRLENICEQLGHKTCDSLFKPVANRLTDSLRTSDAITRLGREEDAAT
ncbi:MAG: protoglobin domain-containing protein, partial [Planctomycetota bacterium]